MGVDNILVATTIGYIAQTKMSARHTPLQHSASELQGVLLPLQPSPEVAWSSSSNMRTNTNWVIFIVGDLLAVRVVQMGTGKQTTKTWTCFSKVLEAIEHLCA